MKENKKNTKDSKPPKKAAKPKSKGGKSKSKAGFFTIVFKLANIICILLMLLAYSAQYISPVHYTWIAFIGLAYLPILISNVFFVIWWAIHRNKMFIYSLVAILIGFNVLFNHISIRFSESEKTNTNKIKILTYNVHNFRMETHDKKKSHKYYKEIVAFVKKENPKIACFQEFFSSAWKDSLANDSLIKNLKFKNHYYLNYITKSKKVVTDALAIFTDYPIINKGFLSNIEKERYVIFADLIINEDTVRLYNIHLTSIHLGTAIDSAEAKSAYKLWKAFNMRAAEVDLLKKEMQESPYPIILCGDFNDTPASYAYTQLSADLKDSFKAAGTTIGNTYYWDWTPVRIDNILHNKAYKSINI